MSPISAERLEQMQAQVDEGGTLNCDQELLNEISRLRAVAVTPPPGGWGEGAPVPDPYHDQLPDQK